jgi:hypothetical protein
MKFVVATLLLAMVVCEEEGQIDGGTIDEPQEEPIVIVETVEPAQEDSVENEDEDDSTQEELIVITLAEPFDWSGAVFLANEDAEGMTESITVGREYGTTHFYIQPRTGNSCTKINVRDDGFEVMPDTSISDFVPDYFTDNDVEEAIIEEQTMCYEDD